MKTKKKVPRRSRQASVPDDGLQVGEEVIFTPNRGKPRKATVNALMGLSLVEISLEGDPFPVNVNRHQLKACNAIGNDIQFKQKVRKHRAEREKGTTSPVPKTDVKALRKQAGKLGVEGWESMGRKELAKAVAKASKNGKAPKAATTETKTKAKSKTAKAPAKTKTPKAKSKAVTETPTKTKAPKTAKAAPKDKGSTAQGAGVSLAKGSTPKSIPADGSNPFRKNSNMHTVAALLLKGGQRSKLAEKLKAKVALHPYQKDAGDVDLTDYDKRLLLGAQTMRDQYGYGIVRTGRGIDGTIRVFIPGSAEDPRSVSTKKAKGRKAA